MARPKGSKNKPKDAKPEIRYVNPVTPEVAAEIYNAEHPEQHTSVYVMTPELEGAIENAMAEASPPIKIQGYNYPSN